MPLVLVAQPIHDAGIDMLRAAGYTVETLPDAAPATILAAIADAEFLIIRDALLPAEALHAASHLKRIIKHGAGLNNIDLPLCKKRNIDVVATPGTNARSTAEHTIMLMLAVAKRAVEANAAVRNGNWAFRYAGGFSELEGKVLGIVGFGAVGRIVADIARAGFGMRIAVWSPSVSITEIEASGAQSCATLDWLLERADVVSIHRPLTAETRHMIGAAQLAKMKRGAILINTARGGLVDSKALAAALTNNHLAGAGLDVFEPEPPGSDDPLLQLPNVILSPHAGGSTEEALMRTSIACANHILGYTK